MDQYVMEYVGKRTAHVIILFWTTLLYLACHQTANQMLVLSKNLKCMSTLTGSDHVIYFMFLF